MSATPTGRRLSARARREQLLGLAADLFARHGYHGLSMEQIADAAGVSKPVLYQHFTGKRELYLAVVRAMVHKMESQLHAALQGPPDAPSRVEEAISTYFGFVEDRRYRLALDQDDLADPVVRAEVSAATRRVAEQVGAMIAEDTGLPTEAAALLASAMRGVATEGSRWWDAHRTVERDQAVRLLTTLVWNGLGSMGGTRAREDPER